MLKTRTMSLLVAAGVFACMALVAVPASAQTDISGAWEITMNTPQGANTVDVTFKQSGQDVSGELTSPLGVAPFKGTLVGDALTVVAPLDIQGTPIELTFNAKVTGSTLSGSVKFGDFGEAPFDGKRKVGGAPAPAAAAAAPAAAPAAAAAAASAAAGTGIDGKWDININVQGQAIPVTATFTRAGDKVTGTLTSPQGDLPVEGTFINNSLKLEFMAPGDMAVSMSGDLSATGLAGKLTVAGFGDGDWTGTRAK